MTFSKRSSVLAIGMVLGLAAPAFAAPKTNLSATNNTIAGPGATSIAIGSAETVFSHPTGSDVCVTVVNTGKAALTVSVTGVSSASPSVPAGSSKAVCSDDTTAIDLTCGEESNCSAQWRVDEN
jgi:hypothetical protein